MYDGVRRVRDIDVTYKTLMRIFIRRSRYPRTESSSISLLCEACPTRLKFLPNKTDPSPFALTDLSGHRSYSVCVMLRPRLPELFSDNLDVGSHRAAGIGRELFHLTNSRKDEKIQMGGTARAV
ncbi:uncharacterized protein LOC111262559 isoform X2 [Varroa jacobsoni]|uniref:uncharacterized protein LOC111262559 isoform X2 n=1 Tax=Varroa jacobsoni TaxID=62625 RepID=UPI000BF3D61D|nr:uncharacterized protein LOC111262559 isoform X2 [Varroa jacobsoni]